MLKQKKYNHKTIFLKSSNKQNSQLSKAFVLIFFDVLALRGCQNSSRDRSVAVRPRVMWLLVLIEYTKSAVWELELHFFVCQKNFVVEIVNIINLIKITIANLVGCYLNTEVYNVINFDDKPHYPVIHCLISLWYLHM